MSIKLQTIIPWAAALLLSLTLQAAKPVVTITPDKASGHYRSGEPVSFTVEVTEDGKPMRSGELTYTLRDGILPFGKGKVEIRDGKGVIRGTRSSPGFLRVRADGRVDGQRVSGSGGAGFDALELQPILDEPEDFDAFWAEGVKAQQALPGKIEMTKLDKYSTKDFTAYLLKVPAVDGGFAYGYLTIPTAKGTFPAVVNVPGAGPGYVAPDTTVWGNKGVISLLMNIHPYEPPTGDRDALKKIYEETYPGKTSYLRRNLEDPKKHTYYRGHLAVNAAIDFVASLPQFDKKNLIIWGSSQGGTYAVAMGALNPNITGVVAAVPGFSDTAGALHGLGSRLADIVIEEPAKRADVLDVARYFDTAYFARRIKSPVLFMANFADLTCTPQSVYVAYNQVKTEKSIVDDLHSGHRFTPEMQKAAREWINQEIGKNSSKRAR